jgi:hypothetical protein
MQKDYIRARKLLGTGVMSDYILSIVDEEFQIEIRDPDTGVAFTGRGMHDVSEATLENEVRRLHRVHHQRRADRVPVSVGEGSITFERGGYLYVARASSSRSTSSAVL